MNSCTIILHLPLHLLRVDGVELLNRLLLEVAHGQAVPLLEHIGVLLLAVNTRVLAVEAKVFCTYGGQCSLPLLSSSPFLQEPIPANPKVVGEEQSVWLNDSHSLVQS